MKKLFIGLMLLGLCGGALGADGNTCTATITITPGLPLNGATITSVQANNTEIASGVNAALTTNKNTTLTIIPNPNMLSSTLTFKGADNTGKTFSITTPETLQTILNSAGSNATDGCPLGIKNALNNTSSPSQHESLGTYCLYCE